MVRRTTTIAALMQTEADSSRKMCALSVVCVPVERTTTGVERRGGSGDAVAEITRQRETMSIVDSSSSVTRAEAA